MSNVDPDYGCAGPTCERCAPVHGAAACVAGQCALATCATGWADCNRVASDGCETPLSKDKHNCGGCGQTCLVGNCEAGTCVWKL